MHHYYRTYSTFVDPTNLTIITDIIPIHQTLFWTDLIALLPTPMAGQPIPDDRKSDQGLQPTLLRVEIQQTKGMQKIDLPHSLHHLYAIILQVDETAQIVSQDQKTIFPTADDIPQDDNIFTSHFTVLKHVNHNNSGQIHLYFSVTSDSTIHQWQQATTLTNYLKTARLCPVSYTHLTLPTIA